MLKIKLIPYESMKEDFRRVMKALEMGSLVLIDSRLNPQEEAELIKDTMERFSEKFTGIELSSVSPPESTSIEKLKNSLAEKLTGKRGGFTIIGPASIVRKIKKNPQELMVYL